MTSGRPSLTWSISMGEGAREIFDACATEPFLLRVAFPRHVGFTRSWWVVMRVLTASRAVHPRTFDESGTPHPLRHKPFGAQFTPYGMTPLASNLKRGNKLSRRARAPCSQNNGPHVFLQITATSVARLFRRPAAALASTSMSRIATPPKLRGLHVAVVRRNAVHSCCSSLFDLISRVSVWPKAVGRGAGPVTAGTRTGQQAAEADVPWLRKRHVWFAICIALEARGETFQILFVIYIVRLAWNACDSCT